MPIFPIPTPPLDDINEPNTNPFAQMAATRGGLMPSMGGHPRGMQTQVQPRWSAGYDTPTRTPRTGSKAYTQMNRIGNEAALTQHLRATASQDDYRLFSEGMNTGLLPYIGMGDITNFVYRQEIDKHRREALPVGGGLDPGAPLRERSIQYGRPLYRDGMEYAVASQWDADTVRQWQRFFGALGFRTSTSGTWGEPEAQAMRAFMGEANRTPGGGTTIQQMRDLVMQQVRSGVYFYRGVNEEGDLLPILLGEEDLVQPQLIEGGGGAGAAAQTEPYTQTVTERQITEYSMGEGMMAVRQAVERQIGRKPTEAEVRNYVRSLNAAFRADPSIITTITTTDPVTGESDMERTVDESDVSAEAEAMEFAEDVSPEERQEFQAGRYFDALMSEIGM